MTVAVFNKTPNSRTPTGKALKKVSCPHHAPSEKDKDNNDEKEKSRFEVIVREQPANEQPAQEQPQEQPNNMVLAHEQQKRRTIFKALQNAIQQKDLALVKRIVHRFRPNLNEVMEPENNETTKTTTQTPVSPLLLLAVKQSAVAIVQFLIDQGGANVQGAVDDYNTALHYALCSVRGSLAMLQLLLARGAAVNATNTPHGYTALHMACMEYNMAAVHVLLTHGASTNVESERGQTPLTLACHGRHHDLVQCLLQAGADPWLCTRYGCPVTIAIRNDDLSLLQTLLAIPDKNSPNSQVILRTRMSKGRTVAHVAASLGRLEILSWILEQQQDLVHVCDDGGQTPLHALCDDGNQTDLFSFSKTSGQEDACMRLLVRAGASLIAKDHKGKAPIHYSIQRETTSVLETLLQLGESPNALDEQGRTPLQLVCDGSFKTSTAETAAECIRVLVNAGASLNQKDPTGNAPIHYAIQNHSIVLETLLDMGADPNTRNQHGQTTLHLYCAAPSALSLPSKSQTIASSSTRKRKRNKKSDKAQEDKNQSEIVNLLCAKGANVFLQDKQGNLPMFLAAEQGVLATAVFNMVCQSASCGLFEGVAKQQQSKHLPIQRHDDDNSPKGCRHKRRVKRRVA